MGSNKQKLLNCWEVKKCSEKEQCSAYIGNPRIDGIHGGVRGGRVCWVLAGTLCGGERQGEFVEKEGNCLKCEFYKQVAQEEGMRLVFSVSLLAKLHQK